MPENQPLSQSSGSPVPTSANNTSPYPASFPENLVFSNYDSSSNNNMSQSQAYTAISSNAGIH